MAFLRTAPIAREPLASTASVFTPAHTAAGSAPCARRIQPTLRVPADYRAWSRRRFIVHADEKLSAFIELERQVLPITFYLECIRPG